MKLDETWLCDLIQNVICFFYSRLSLHLLCSCFCLCSYEIKSVIDDVVKFIEYFSYQKF